MQSPDCVATSSDLPYPRAAHSGSVEDIPPTSNAWALQDAGRTPPHPHSPLNTKNSPMAR